jgi:histidyl-tRNA synthetase
MELLPQQQIVFNHMIDVIRKNYEKYGYTPLDTVTIEASDVLLAKTGGDTEKQVYRFQRGDTDMSLRFDLTVPLARYVAMHARDLAFPFKRYQISKVYRGESPQKGRFREFYQCDIDVIGKDKLPIAYDAEFPNIIYLILKELGIPNFQVQMNKRKLLSGFFESIGMQERSVEMMRVIDKVDKLSVKEIYSRINQCAFQW